MCKPLQNLAGIVCYLLRRGNRRRLSVAGFRPDGAGNALRPDHPPNFALLGVKRPLNCFFEWLSIPITALLTVDARVEVKKY